jgi:hypothetical protein
LKNEGKCITLLSKRGLGGLGGNRGFSVPIRQRTTAPFPLHPTKASRADQKTRQIMASYFTKAMEAITDSKAFRHPDSKYINPKTSLIFGTQGTTKKGKHLSKHITRDPTIYAVVDDPPPPPYPSNSPSSLKSRILKIGMATKPSVRYEKYVEEDRKFKQHNFVPVVRMEDLDILSQCTLSKQVELILHKLIESKSPRITDQAKRYYKGILAVPRRADESDDEYFLNGPKLRKVTEDDMTYSEYRHWGRGGIRNALLFGWIEFTIQDYFGLVSRL